MQQLRKMAGKGDTPGPKKAPFVVIVTGGGLYMGNDYNSSFELVKALPDHFRRGAGKPDIKLLKLKQPVPSDFAEARRLVEDVWLPGRTRRDMFLPADAATGAGAGAGLRIDINDVDIDLDGHGSDDQTGGGVPVRLVLHVGQRDYSPAGEFCFENYARTGPYAVPDEGGELPDPEDYEPGGYLHDLPAVLRSGLDVARAQRDTQAALASGGGREGVGGGETGREGGTAAEGGGGGRYKTRVSDMERDSGPEGTEWIFLHGLVCQRMRLETPGLREPRRHCAVLHTPRGRKEGDLRAGIEVMRAYLSALADQIEEMDAKGGK